MKILFPALFFVFIGNLHAQRVSESLPVWNTRFEQNIPKDWLVVPVSIRAEIFKSPDGKDLILYNGLVKRTFRIQPEVACIDYKNMINGQELLRAVKAEASVTINGKEYNVGGLKGQKENAYLLPQWVNNFTAEVNGFRFQSYTVTDIQPYINWKTKGWAGNRQQPTGKELSFLYRSPIKELKDLIITVHYELYDGLPLIVKWLSVKNNSDGMIELNKVVNEILATVEEESAVVGKSRNTGKPEETITNGGNEKLPAIGMNIQHGLYIETNYAFNNAMRYDISDQTTHWKTDSAYTSQVNYDLETPCLLEVYPGKVTGVELQPGEDFKSVRSYELLIDSYDRERRGLAIRKMYRAIAPWTTENPIFMHLVSKNDEEVYTAIDQCAATGYEALILSFGSHCNMEDSSSANITKWKKIAAYAHSKKIMIGGYSLFSSRRISDEDDVIDPVTGKPDLGAFFGSAPCLASRWGLAYIHKLKYFITHTAFDLFENDGPYPGDVCASTTHPGHKGLDDSQWRQMELQKELYRWCNEHGIYVNAPDWYFLDGTNKIGIGYRETNFSLPRENQEILNRQNIFDGLWEKTPSMCWGFVPLTKYQGGGPEAVLEPLSEHLKDYKQLMTQYYGSGVQACYRGRRLYDTEETKETVISVVHWYKQYRDILNSDIIHLRRADGRDWDGILHVNSQLKTKGLLMLFNPTREKITRVIKIPLYYTGLIKIARIREKEGVIKAYPLNRNYEVVMTVTLEPDAYSWWAIE